MTALGQRVSAAPAWLLGLVPLLLIAGAVTLFAVLGGPGLGDRRGPPVEELAVERTVLEPGVIELTLRNDGPDEVTVAQAVVNDAFAQFSGAEEPIGRLGTAVVRVQQPWIEGEAYEVALLLSTGGTIVHEIPVAVETPEAGLSFFGLLALLGLYVGVIPVALGMLWLPWVRRIPPAWLRLVMALTIGLLAFLAVDATLEGFELAAAGSQVFGGGGLVLVGAGLVAGEAAQLGTDAFQPGPVAAWAYLAVMGSVVGFSAYAWLLKHAPISQVVTHQYVNPLVAVALGALLLGERPAPTTLAGAALIVGAVVVTARHEGRAADAPAVESSPEPSEPERRAA